MSLKSKEILFLLQISGKFDILRGYQVKNNQELLQLLLKNLTF